MDANPTPILIPQSILRVVGAVGLILLIPLLAMQVSDDFRWTPFDFAAAGVLLVGAGLLLELTMRNVSRINYRIAFAAAIVLALVIVWVQLAAGIID